MNRRIAIAASAVILLLLGGFSVWAWLHNQQFTLLRPQGFIAGEQARLMLVVTGLMLLVVVPVFGLIFGIALHYRAGNTRATYRPDWDSDRRLEALWWGIPVIIIGVLAVITWRSSHDLDPYRPLASSAAQPALRVQVVALQWKWLFIYPEQHIATVNLLEIPAHRPVQFEITADAPMNSFWIPELGGQIYAMSGMSTRLGLQADRVGDYRGLSANLSGNGFADMNFTTRAVTELQFETWLNQVRAAGGGLDQDSYDRLAAPTTNHPVQTYAVAADGLYDDIMMKYMMPATPAANHGGHTY